MNNKICHNVNFVATAQAPEVVVMTSGGTNYDNDDLWHYDNIRFQCSNAYFIAIFT